MAYDEREEDKDLGVPLGEMTNDSDEEEEGGVLEKGGEAEEEEYE